MYSLPIESEFRAIRPSRILVQFFSKYRGKLLKMRTIRDRLNKEELGPVYRTELHITISYPADTT
jgi:hypothetical protein